jgi:hypothetical protein
VVRACAAAWLGSCLAGLLGLGAAAADLEGLRTRLVAVAREDDPSRPADLVREGVQATLAAAAGGTAVLLVLVAVSVVLLLRRRPVGRWGLAVAGALTLLAVDVDQGLVRGGVEVDRVGFLVQGGLVVLGLLTLLPRAARAWVHRGS